MIPERLALRHEAQFIAFLTRLVEMGDDKFFHPHDLSAAGARAIIALATEGVDEYWAGLNDGRLAVYGMLRGWRAGYEVPSLGIAVAPEQRGGGIGKAMIHHLHSVARARGAKRVRLTVCRTNVAAIRLYTSLGYRFPDQSDAVMVGFIDLADA